MIYKIVDKDHIEGGKSIIANSPRDALHEYAFTECQDLMDGDDTEVTIETPDGIKFKGSIEAEDIREYNLCVWTLREDKK